MLPTQDQEHETIKLTEGINDWSEIGFYIFTAEKSGNGVRQTAFSNPTWSWQIMPIVDQTIARWYW